MKYNRRIIDGHEISYSADWIHDLESEAHFQYYYTQLSLVYKYCAREDLLLELGLGNALLSDVLKRRKFAVSTLDIDAKKLPDYCCDASEFDYSTKPFRNLLAFEVFEHIPYSTFEKVLDRISNSEVRAIIFSVPWCETTIQPLTLRVLPSFPFHLKFCIPRRRLMTSAHFWELSRRRNPVTLSSDRSIIPNREFFNTFRQKGWSLEKKQRLYSIQFFLATR